MTARTKYLGSVGFVVAVLLALVYIFAHPVRPNPAKFSSWPAELQACVNKPLGDALWCLAYGTDNFDRYKPTLMAEWKKRHG